MTSALVSIIIPCFNHAQYLPDALDSVFAQSFSNWECIIVNDGSSDDTEEVALGYCKMDSRFIYLQKENGGTSSARNAGIRKSLGNYILPLDADDKIEVEYLQKAVEVLDNSADVKVVYGEVEFFGVETGIWELPPFSLRQLALGNMIYCSAFFRRSDFNQYGGYDESFLFGLEDWEFWLRILKDGGSVVKLSPVYFYYRKKENSRTNSLLNNEDWNIKMKNKLYVKHSDLYTKLFGDLIIMIVDKRKLEHKLEETQNQLERRVAQIKLIYESSSFRLGNFILKPLRFLNWKK